MRVLGVDFGLRNVGLAFGDSEGAIATPLRSLRIASVRDAPAAVAAAAREAGADAIVVGVPLGLEGQVDQARQDEVKLWNQALRQYRQQDWDRAEVELLNLRKRAPDSGLYALLLDRIAHYRSHPPGADWDGAWTFETK